MSAKPKPAGKPEPKPPELTPAPPRMPLFQARATTAQVVGNLAQQLFALDSVLYSVDRNRLDASSKQALEAAEDSLRDTAQRLYRDAGRMLGAFGAPQPGEDQEP